MSSTAFTSAKIIGLTGAAWLSGTIASISLVSVPAVTQSLNQDNLPIAHAIKLWRHNFNLGKGLAPSIALTTAAALAFCGWRTRERRAEGARDGRLYFVGALLTVAIVPFTIVFMGKTNAALLGLAEKTVLSATEGREGAALLKKWVSLNGVRSLLPLAGAVLTGFLALA